MSWIWAMIPIGCVLAVMVSRTNRMESMKERIAKLEVKVEKLEKKNK